MVKSFEQFSKEIENEDMLEGVSEVETPETTDSADGSESTSSEGEVTVARKRGRPAGSGKAKAPVDPNAPKKPRGRPAGAANKRTLEAAAALGVSVEQLKLQASEKSLTIAEYVDFINGNGSTVSSSTEATI